MNPEEVIAAINRFRAQGYSDTDINKVLPKVTKGAFRDIAAVERSIQSRQARPKEDRDQLVGVGDALRNLFQGVTGGWGDEAIGLVVGALDPNRTRAEVTQQSRDRLARLRSERPIMSIVGEALGGVAPGAAITKGLQAAGLAGRATQGSGALRGAAEVLTGGGPRTTLTRQVGRAARTGAIVGGTEGALIGAGESDENSRLLGALLGGAGGAGLGTTLGLVGATPHLTRKVVQSGRTASQDLAREMERIVGGRPTRPVGQTAAREAVDTSPSAVTLLAQKDPAVRRELQRMGANNPELGPVLRGSIDGSSSPALTVREVDAVSDALRNRISAGLAPDAPPGAARHAKQAAEALEEVKADLAARGVPPARITAMTSDLDAFKKGMSLRRNAKSGAEMEQALAGVLPESREYMRAGMALDFIETLDRQAGTPFKPASAAQNAFTMGPGEMAKLRYMFPDGASGDAMFDDLVETIRLTGDTVAIGSKVRALLGGLALGAFGSSLFAELFIPN